MCGFWRTHGNELHLYECANFAGGERHKNVLWECTVVGTTEERYSSRDAQRWKTWETGYCSTSKDENVTLNAEKVWVEWEAMGYCDSKKGYGLHGQAEVWRLDCAVRIEQSFWESGWSITWTEVVASNPVANNGAHTSIASLTSCSVEYVSLILILQKSDRILCVHWVHPVTATEVFMDLCWQSL